MLRLAAPLFVATALLDARGSAQVCGSDASAVHLGGGSPGTLGVPVLGYQGAPIVGRPFVITLERALPNSLAVFAASVPSSPLPLPAYGAVQHVGVPIALAFVPVDAHGRATGFLDQAQLAPSTCGIGIHVQALVGDPGAAGFLAFSSGLSIRVGSAAAEHLSAWRLHDGGGLLEPLLADFDQDGHLDTVGTQGSVSVALGDGTGGFLAPTTVFTSAPNDVEAVDLDNDGLPDLCASFNVAPIVRVAFSGGGAFTPGPSSNVAVNARRLEIGNVDGDGVPDLVTFNATAQSVEVRLAVQPGEFGAPQSFAFPGLPLWMELEDLDADGFADLVLPNTAGGLSVLLGTGTGAFGAPTAYSAGTFPAAVELADFDDDGDVDLAFTSSSTLVHVLDGNGDGSFGSLDSVWVGSAQRDVDAVDVDLDGRLDLAVVRGDPAEMAFVRSKGAGKFAFLGTTPVPQWGRLSAVGDLDGDGQEDLALSVSTPPGTVAVRLRADGAFFGTPASLVSDGQSSYALATGHLDADDHLDFVRTDPVAKTITTHLGDGSGGFTIGAAISSTGGPLHPSLADFDGDGVLDLAVTLLTANQVAVHRGLGEGTLGAPLLLSTYWSQFGFKAGATQVVDANGDGDLDLLTEWHHEALGTYRISVWFGDGSGAFSAPVEAGESRSLEAVAAADLDGDGLADLLMVLGNPYELSVRLGVGDGTFAPHASIAVPYAVFELVLGDLDGDQQVDLVATCNGQGLPGQPAPWTVAAMLGNGDGSFEPAIPFPPGAAALGSRLLDVDGDTHLDFVSTYASTDVWFGVGDGSFQPVRRYWPNELLVGDFDGEGLPDALVFDGATATVRPNPFVE